MKGARAIMLSMMICAVVNGAFGADTPGVTGLDKATSMSKDAGATSVTISGSASTDAGATTATAPQTVMGAIDEKIMAEEMSGDPKMMDQMEALATEMHQVVADMALMLKSCEGVKGDETSQARMDGIRTPLRISDVFTGETPTAFGQKFGLMRHAHMAARIRRVQTSMVDLLETMKNCAGIKDVAANMDMADQLAVGINQLHGGVAGQPTTLPRRADWGLVDQPTTVSRRALIRLMGSDEVTSAPLGLRKQYRNLLQMQETYRMMGNVLDMMEKIKTVQSDESMKKSVTAMKVQIEKTGAETDKLMADCKRLMSEKRSVIPQPGMGTGTTEAKTTGTSSAVVPVPGK